MLSALACVLGLWVTIPNIRNTLKTCLIMMTIGLVDWIKGIRFHSRDWSKHVLSFRDNIREKMNIIRRMWSGYWSGTITRQIVFEFILFRIRMQLVNHFEIGRISYIQHLQAYDIVYYDGDRKFRVRFPKNRGVRQIIRVKDSLGNDVTSAIFEFLGPGQNFHGVSSSPKLLGWKDGLVVQYRNGDEIKYEPNEEIKLRVF